MHLTTSRIFYLSLMRVVVLNLKTHSASDASLQWSCQVWWTVPEHSSRRFFNTSVREIFGKKILCTDMNITILMKVDNKFNNIYIFMMNVRHPHTLSIEYAIYAEKHLHLSTKTLYSLLSSFLIPSIYFKY